MKKILEKNKISGPINFQNEKFVGSIGNGIHHKGVNFITHSSLHHRHSAIETLHKHQKVILMFILALIIWGGLANFQETVTIIIIGLSVLYFFDLLFNLFLIFESLQKSKEIIVTGDEIKKINEDKLPIYTIFCPLYKEWQVLSQFTNAIANIDWPKNKLDVQLLLEEDDCETIKEAKRMQLPGFFRIIVVPHGHPKTKPKACNYGLCHAKGEYAVIFDAEDIPDSDQLKKAYLTFQKEGSEKIVCAQAKLNFYNSSQNLLTRMFSAEYSLWFGLILTGLQTIKSPIPLGGTSNHFRTKDLKKLNGWDPFNVTEDCDLGIRIAKLGYHTAIFNSKTMEEATSKVGNWMRQRSRWIKGYMQTYLVHMRRPHEFMSDLKNPNIITFQLVVGGKVASMFINPAMWITTLFYFMFRDSFGRVIDPIFPAVALYIGGLSLIFGNFLYLYYYMIGCARRGNWNLIIYVVFTPIYWLMMSIAAWKALFQLILKPHYWEKTNHGFHLINKESMNYPAA